MTERTRADLIAETFGDTPTRRTEPPEQPPGPDRRPDPAQQAAPIRDDYAHAADDFFNIPNNW